MATGAGLGALATLEVKRLHFLEQFFLVTELGAGQLVEVSGIFLLLLRQHAALARADAGARKLGATSESNLGLLRQCPEAHVGNE